MRVERTTRDRALVELTNDELGILGNALNEVCHGIDLAEFSTRIGANKREVLRLLHELSDVFHRLDKPQ